jgi:hypothetical protein
VAVCLNTAALVNNADDNTDDAALAALLLDRRLIKAKGPRITSFFSGSVLAFLPDAPLFPDSTVLVAVPLATLDAFTPLVVAAVGSGRRFKMLFRSSRDGATAAAFHSRCDAQGPTLTLIRDTAGNVFGGYTSLDWSSPVVGPYNGGTLWLNDPASFLFTVVNPHADPPALFPSNSGYAIVCCPRSGPYFNHDLHVGGTFDAACCSSIIGWGYINSTRHDAITVLTGAHRFTPAEVELWGLADD